MSYKTLEVELEDGRVRARGAETLPNKAYGLLTLLDPKSSLATLTCGELADRWTQMEKLPAEEARAFADDLDQARAHLPPLTATWD